MNNWFERVPECWPLSHVTSKRIQCKLWQSHVITRRCNRRRDRASRVADGVTELKGGCTVSALMILFWPNYPTVQLHLQERLLQCNIGSQHSFSSVVLPFLLDCALIGVPSCGQEKGSPVLRPVRLPSLLQISATSSNLSLLGKFIRAHLESFKVRLCSWFNQFSLGCLVRWVQPIRLGGPCHKQLPLVLCAYSRLYLGTIYTTVQLLLALSSVQIQ